MIEDDIVIEAGEEVKCIYMLSLAAQGGSDPS